MNEQQRKEMLILADTIQGEINRICVTNDVNEFDKMTYYAINNIRTLYEMRYKCDFANK